MREPWDLAQQFIQGLQQRNAQTRDTTDRALLRAMSENVARTNMGIQQDYGLEELSERNRYATVADTTAYERQIARDRQAYEQAAASQAANRRYAVQDMATEQSNRQANIILEQQALAEREALERGGTSVAGARRFGNFNAPAGDDAYTASTIQRESGGNPNAKNPLSSATGLGQFLEGTWADLMRRHPELGLTPDGRTDPAQTKRALDVFTSENVGILGRHGIEPTDANKYAAHFLGAGDAVKVLRAPDSDPIYRHVTPASMRANPHLKNMTVADFKAWTAKGRGGTDDTGSRRYTQDDTFNPSSSVLTTPITSQAAGIRNEDVAGVSPWLKSYLDEQGLEPVRRVTMTEKQFDLLPPELAQNLIPDIADTSTMGQKGAKTEYIQVQPRAQQSEITNAGGLPRPKETSATPIEVKDRGRGRYVDGKLTFEDQEIELPD